MKVLHISGARSWGGNEQQLIDLIPELEKLGVDNLVFGVKNQPLHDRCNSLNIDFVYSETPKLNKFSNYRFLKDILKSESIDVIHLHTSDSVTVFVMADLLFKLKTPTVFSKKGMGNSMSLLSKFKYNYKNINAILCVSEAVRASMEDIVMYPKNINKLKVVYEGINVDRIEKAPKEIPSIVNQLRETEKMKLVNIANHAAAKDLNTLLRSVAYMVHELHYKDFHLFQVGSFNKHTEELKTLSKELKITEFVTFVGFVKNATSLLSYFDVFIMSSEREGLPLTVYEAFYKKVPVVSTKAGGIPEIIEDGTNGFLSNIKDYKTLGDKAYRLLSDKDLSFKFSERSYELFNEKYTTRIAAGNIQSIYSRYIQ